MVPTIEEVTIRQTFSEIARHISLQNTLFESSPKCEPDAQNCRALINFNQFLRQFSLFNTLLRRIDYQKLILMRNKHDIQNQHKKLHRIAYILTEYFFYEKTTCTPPQPFSPELNPVVPHRLICDEKNI